MKKRKEKRQPNSSSTQTKNPGSDSFPACSSVVPCGVYRAGSLDPDELTENKAILYSALISNGVVIRQCDKNDYLQCIYKQNQAIQAKI